jgi:hypothetical protein
MGVIVDNGIVGVAVGAFVPSTTSAIGVGSFVYAQAPIAKTAKKRKRNKTRFVLSSKCDIEASKLSECGFNLSVDDDKGITEELHLGNKQALLLSTHGFKVNVQGSCHMRIKNTL